MLGQAGAASTAAHGQSAINPSPHSSVAPPLISPSSAPPENDGAALHRRDAQPRGTPPAAVAVAAVGRRGGARRRGGLVAPPRRTSLHGRRRCREALELLTREPSRPYVSQAVTTTPLLHTCAAAALPTARVSEAGPPRQAPHPLAASGACQLSGRGTPCQHHLQRAAQRVAGGAGEAGGPARLHVAVCRATRRTRGARGGCFSSIDYGVGIPKRLPRSSPQLLPAQLTPRLRQAGMLGVTPSAGLCSYCTLP